MEKIGKYEIEGVLGKGAMGIIYKAFDPLLERHVAIKTMSKEVINDPDLRKRFYREAKAAGALHHPQIIVIYDFGEENNIPYIVMEFLKGKDLKKIIKEKMKLSFTKIVDIGIQISEGLNFAHENNVIHRDIKPANIFLCDDGTVKILDFGVAFVLNSTLTQSGVLLGSLGYMAPEQIMGQKLTGAADQYSVGVILYELVTGLKPFLGSDINSTIKAILKTDPFPPIKLTEDCPQELNQLILKMLSKDPSERYPSMSHVSEELKKLYKKLSDEEKSKTSVIKDDTTQMFKDFESLKEYCENLLSEGKIKTVYSILKVNSVLFKNEISFQEYFEFVKNLKKKYDKKILFEKHLSDVENLIKEENYELARMEIETLLKLDPNSKKLLKLKRELNKREKIEELRNFGEQLETLIEKTKLSEAEKVLANIESKFNDLEEFIILKKKILSKIEDKKVKQVIKNSKDLAAQGLFTDAIVLIRENLKKYKDNELLINIYNELMEKKLKHEEERKREKFISEQLQIVKLLEKSKQYEQAKKYLIVLLEKYPETSSFEEELINVENLIEREKSIKELHELIKSKEYKKAQETFNLLKEAYPEDPQISILEHQLEHLKLSLLEENSKILSQNKIENAIKLADKGEYEKALAIIRELMDENPGQTFLYTNYLKIKTEKEKYEKELFLSTLEEINKLEQEGNLLEAIVKAKELKEKFEEESLTSLITILQKQYIKQQRELISNLIEENQIPEAEIILNKNLNIFPNLEEIKTLKSMVEEAKNQEIYIKDEFEKAKKLAAEQNYEKALEILNKIIPLDRKNEELKEFLKEIILKKTRMM